mgnify:CR=1 FL=1
MGGRANRLRFAGRSGPAAWLGAAAWLGLAAWSGLVGPGCSAGREAATMSQRPIVIAHRGASGYRPEHTLAAYRLAIEQGADFIEADVVPTRDGALVCRHENEISQTTDVASHPRFAHRRAVRTIDGVRVEGWFTEDFTLDELRTLRAVERLPFRDACFNGRFPVPTLDEAIDLAVEESRRRGRTVGVYIETKHPTYFRELGLPVEERLVALLERQGWRDRAAPVYLQSFEVENLRRLRRLSGVRLVQLMDAQGGPWDQAGRLTYAQMATPEGLAQIARYADAIGVNKLMVIPAEGTGLGAPTRLIADAHRVGLAVHVWTFRSDAPFLHGSYRTAADEYRRFLALGVDGLFSDFPDHALDSIRP